MKTIVHKLLPGRAPLFAVLGISLLASVSCMTTYDAYGRPVQSVDPGVAVAGAVAAGLVGAAIANNNDHHHYHGGYYGGGYYHRAPYRYGGRAYNGYRGR